MEYVLAAMFVPGGAARPPWREPDLETRYGLERARRYVAAELGTPLPNLDDTWLPWILWILALGLGCEVDAWRRREPSVGYVAVDASPGTLVGRWSGGTMREAPSASGWTARLAR